MPRETHILDLTQQERDRMWQAAKAGANNVPPATRMPPVSGAVEGCLISNYQPNKSGSTRKED